MYYFIKTATYSNQFYLLVIYFLSLVILYLSFLSISWFFLFVCPFINLPIISPIFAVIHLSTHPFIFGTNWTKLD